MSQNSLRNPSAQATHLTWENFPYGRLFIALMTSAILLGAVVLASPLGGFPRALLTQWFALDSSRVTWYITRSAGITAYLLLWLSTVWGLAIPTRLLDNRLGRAFTFDFHQFISLLSLGFLVLHIVILAADSFMPYSLLQLVLPFLSPYRPVWVGIGSLSLYLTLLATASFYLRKRIGQRLFRFLHAGSLLAYLGATIHGLMAGADAALPAAWFMYVSTFLVVIFLAAYWLILPLTASKTAAAPTTGTRN